MEWAFQEHDVSETLEPSCRDRGPRRFVSVRQNHEWQVGPLGLSRNPSGKSLPITRGERLLGDENSAYTFREVSDESIEVVAGDAIHPVLVQQIASHSGVSPPWSKD
jgi:hypothetical protein